MQLKCESFDYYEKQALEKCNNSEYAVANKRVRRSNVRLDTPGTHQTSVERPTQKSSANSFKTESFLPVIDSLLSALKQRIEGYTYKYNLHSFFRKIPTIKLEELKTVASRLVDEFPDDLSNPELENELCQFVSFAKAFGSEKPENLSLEHYWYNLIIDKKVSSTFSNILIILRIYLVLMITNCSGERSFSKLKLICNRLLQKRLNSLALMSIEHYVMRDIDFSSFITDFANTKARKVIL